ncbi:hypothetical protein R3P38DRAFT_3597855 [Favolaschia claudopus]|uniref:Uncharacterized protein n=1 Tax=Favolaschia claudopus TaxID=2862362 RepID=A0AAW0AEJ3_9AGAR
MTICVILPLWRPHAYGVEVGCYWRTLLAVPVLVWFLCRPQQHDLPSTVRTARYTTNHRVSGSMRQPILLHFSKANCDPASKPPPTRFTSQPTINLTVPSNHRLACDLLLLFLDDDKPLLTMSISIHRVGLSILSIHLFLHPVYYLVLTKMLYTQTPPIAICAPPDPMRREDGRRPLCRHAPQYNKLESTSSSPPVVILQGCFFESPFDTTQTELTNGTLPPAIGPSEPKTSLGGASALASLEDDDEYL